MIFAFSQSIFTQKLHIGLFWKKFSAKICLKNPIFLVHIVELYLDVEKRATKPLAPAMEIRQLKAGLILARMKNDKTIKIA